MVDIHIKASPKSLQARIHVYEPVDWKSSSCLLQLSKRGSQEKSRLRGSSKSRD